MRLELRSQASFHTLQILFLIEFQTYRKSIAVLVSSVKETILFNVMISLNGLRSGTSPIVYA
jgi:hypothetical protein